MNITATTSVTGVIGHPIAHSLSPLMHNFWIRKQNINAVYLAFDIAKEDSVTKALDGLFLSGVQGVNVTIPFKEAAFSYAEKLTDAAQQAKAVNTLYFSQGVLWGDNSDGFGFINALKVSNAEILPIIEKIVIFGAGGAARGIIQALLHYKNYHITLVNRTLEKCKAIQEEINIYYPDAVIEFTSWEACHLKLAQAELCINTTSLGLKAQDKFPEILASAKQCKFCYDIVYNPLLTPFLKQAQKFNIPVLNGLGMLIWQGSIGFEKWFGIMPEIDTTLYTLLENNI